MSTGDSIASPLPQPVEQLIQKICSAQNQPPLSDTSRKRLDFVGEEVALSTLQHIDQRVKITRSFDGIVYFLLKDYLSEKGSPGKCQNHSPVTPPASPVRVGDNTLSTSPRAQFQQNFSPQTPPRYRTVLLMPDDSFVTPPANQNHSPCTPPGGRTVPLIPPLDNASRSPIHDQRIPSLPPANSGMEMAESFIPQLEIISDQMMALGELEFRKAFLILNYIGFNKLEDAISAEEIRGIKDLQMMYFEPTVWNLLSRNVNISDRCKNLNWESTRTHVYHCHVFPNGNLKFKGPFLEPTKTHLQRVLGDENVLVVKFVDDKESKGSTSGQYCPAYRKVLKEGISLGLRLYRFFVFKDGGKEAKKKDQTTSSSVRCIFVRMESKAAVDAYQDYLLAGKTIQEARSLFMNVHTLLPNISKYMIRLSLVLSKTLKLDIDFDEVHFEVIDDICCQDANGKTIKDKDGEDCIHTDGTGFISEDLAVKCPKSVFHGSYHDKGNSEVNLLNVKQPYLPFPEPPLLIQCRLYYNGLAAKGTLLVNKNLKKTIQVRESMVKVKEVPNSNIRSQNSLEVVSTSNRPRRAALSRYLIALLCFGGVPEDFFMDALRNALEDAQSVFSNKQAALRVSVNYGTMDELLAARTILSGIPLEEAYLQYRLFIMSREEKAGLKAGRIPIDDCYYLMGTADPTGILERNEVCIILDNGQISGDVLVYRHPGLHFGDIHVLTAKYVKELEAYVGEAKYGIFFPCKGSRSLSDEMGGGDLDGDMYFISKNQQLLQYFKDESPRWEPSSSSCSGSNKNPSKLSDGELEEELSSLLLKSTFQPSYTVGVAADSWMATMDRYLLLENGSAEKKRLEKKILRLIDIYYEALDAPKNRGGKIEVPQELKAYKFPHYMEKGKNSFESTSVLGKIYDYVKSHGEEKFSSKGIQKLPCFMVDTPEVQSYVRKWRDLYNRYRGDMASALNSNHQGEMKSQAADDIIKKYKHELYGAAEFERSEKPLKEIYDEAIAVYQVTYDYAIRINDVNKCGFAWKVAGPALCQFYATELCEKSLCIAPSVLKMLFGLKMV